MQLIARCAYKIDAICEAQTLYLHDGKNLVQHVSYDPTQPSERWETWTDEATFTWLTEAPEQIELGQKGPIKEPQALHSSFFSRFFGP